MKYFAYCRKSSEGEDRQALSNPAQRDEILRAFSDVTGIEIVEFFEEAMSAKAPGRPIYGQMIKRIEAGEAQGIVAWHPDRLARNSVDGGWIIHLLDRGVLKDLKFVSYSYEQSAQGMFMLQIMFGQSKYYVDNLSVNVKRGMRKKIALGWLPNLAPLGYLNDRENSAIKTDPERFLLLRRAWDLLLSGGCSVSDIHETLTHEMGFRTPMRKRSGGRPISLSGLYRLFGNPFYAGVIDWAGRWHPGKHEPMISLGEYERAQELLRRPGAPRPKTLKFAYTGLIRCPCGLSITAERRIKPSGRTYVYYHCTRRSIPRCDQPAVRVEALEKQIGAGLKRLQLSEEVATLLSEILSREDDEAKQLQTDLAASKQAAIERNKRELDTLLDLRVRGMIEDDEFAARREGLRREGMRLREATTGDDPAPVFELGQLALSFRKYAMDWFFSADDEDKRLILRTLCSNSVLEGKKLRIEARFPFREVEKNADPCHLRAIVEEVRTQPDKVEEALELIEAIKSLAARAKAREGGLPKPVGRVTAKFGNAKGRAAWRPAELRKAA
jgi:DNA invertase Pin-like site-specific DNA recombinase